jgi:hypothetical protein
MAAPYWFARQSRLQITPAISLNDINFKLPAAQAGKLVRSISAPASHCTSDLFKLKCVGLRSPVSFASSAARFVAARFYQSSSRVNQLGASGSAPT